MNLIDKLPYFLQEVREVKEIQQALEIERVILEKHFEEVIKQLFVKTSTEWGIQFWEEFLGLKVDNAMTLDTRKAIIAAKLKAINISSLENIKKLCEGFTDGTVEIIEDNTHYKFTITLSEGGISDTGDLVKQVNEIKPAHLAYEIITALTNIIHFYASKRAIRQAYKKTSANLKTSINLKNTRSEVYENVESIY